MKRINLLLVALLCSMTSIFAHGHGNHYHGNAKSKLNVALWNNSSFKVTFNHNVFHNTNDFNLANIKPGVHYLKVERIIPNPYGNGAMKRLMFKGEIEIPPRSRVFALVSPHKTLKVKVQKLQNNHFTHGNNCGYLNGYSCSCNNNGYSGYNPVCGTGDEYGYYDDFYGNDFGWDYNPNEEEYYYMSDRKFNDLKRSMENSSFDSGRLNIVKQAIRNEKLRTDQVASLMKSLTFDSNKLILAKLTYNQTVDKENFFRVNDEFTFNSSINKLNQYIEKQG